MINDIITDNEHTFYFNQPSIIFDENFLFDEDKIAALKKYALVIADFSSEHYGQDTIDTVYECFKSRKINFILLSHTVDDHLRRDNLFFYPYWYHWSKKSFRQIYTDNIDKLEKKHPVSCLNSNPRFHRIYNFLLLQGKPYFKDWVFTIHQSALIPARGDDYTLSIEHVDQWNKLSGTLPRRENLNSSSNVNDISYLAYTDSYINLVTETTVVPKIFVSEKTWKPIASGQMFLVIGNPGTIDYLRQQGVDTYDDLIDHKYYDNEPNWQLRIQKIHSIIESLQLQDLLKLNEITKKRRLDNATKFFAGEFDAQYSKDIVSCINMLN